MRRGSGMSGPMGPSGPGMQGMARGGSGSMRPPSAMGMGQGQTRSYMTAPGAMRTGAVPAAGGSDPNRAASDQHDDNLVELTIYGIATLYRAPDAPPTTEQSAQSGTPAPQPSQQPAPPPAPQATSGQPSGGPSPPAPKQPDKNADPQKAPPQANTPQPSGGASPATPKQPDKAVDQKKAPPPPSPPAGKKR